MPIESTIMAHAMKTRDHSTIRKWVEERGGTPSTVESTMTDDSPGLLRVNFPGYSGEETLRALSWEDFFSKFDGEDLEFLYQDTTDSGELSRFCKFVNGEPG
jgi:hypothetical protein